MLRMLAHGMLRLAPYVRKFQRMAFFQAVFWAHSSHDSYVLGANCLLFAEMDTLNLCTMSSQLKVTLLKRPVSKLDDDIALRDWKPTSLSLRCTSTPYFSASKGPQGPLACAVNSASEREGGSPRKPFETSGLKVLSFPKITSYSSMEILKQRRKRTKFLPRICMILAAQR